MFRLQPANYSNEILLGYIGKREEVQDKKRGDKFAN